MEVGVIDNFSGEYRFLSNFYTSHIVINGILYPTVEHAFQAQKSLDINVRQRIAHLATPGEAKRMGRKVNLRPNWETIKSDIMYQLLKIKFAQGNSLAIKLKETHPSELIEGNWWNDTYWGVCNGVGENILGKLLMKVREELLNEKP